MEKASSESPSFLAQHEFLIRRLHSLTGLVPVGAYMVVHLLTNASVLDSPETFQRSVYMIHSLGAILPIVEWGFIFLPLLFHTVLGFVIIAGGVPNTTAYPYEPNVRYTLQRVSGMIAAVFIVWHVFHMHGWFHTEWWLTNVAHPLSGGQFAPYNASSTASEALRGSILVMALYAVGIVACVYHLANGIWTAGITWGVLVSPTAQYRAGLACWVFGLGLGLVGLSALAGMASVDSKLAREIEDQMYEERVKSFEIKPNEHKRAKPHGTQGGETTAARATPAHP